MPRRGLAQIVNADASSAKTLVVAGSNGNKVVNIVASSNDSSARDIQVSLVRGATTTYLLATTTVVANSGNVAGTAPADLLAIIPNLARDQDGQPYLFLEGGDSLVVSALTTVTAAKTVNVHSDHAEF